MTNTLQTRWGSDTVAVTADWAQASAPIQGLDGLQVADVRHRAHEALWVALDRAARADGMAHAADCTTDRDGYDDDCATCRAIAEAADRAHEPQTGDVAIRAWVEAALAPESRAGLSARDIAAIDQEMVGAMGLDHAHLLSDAGGEEAVAAYLAQRYA